MNMVAIKSFDHRGKLLAERRLGRKERRQLEAVPAKLLPGQAPIDERLPWHIVHCVGRTDDYAIEFLKERAIETYYPRVRELRAVPKRTLSKQQRALGLKIMKYQLVPLLPRYLFVRMDLGKPGWRDVFAYAGIGGMVCEGNLPVRVPDAMINGIRGEEVDGAVPGITPARAVFKTGENLRIKDGPFSGLSAQVEYPLDVTIEEIDASTRIRVVVALLGGHTPVELHVSQIERL